MNKKLKLLQVYRGIAALLVVFAHGNIIIEHNIHQYLLSDIFHFGWIGVDFFFVLSGFIIFHIHQSDIGQSNKFKSFILKRFLRVYPLYWIILSFKLVISLLVKTTSNISPNIDEVVKAILLLPQERDILERFFLGVSWTLNHEIFFYAIFSMLIIIKPKFYLPLIIIWILGLIASTINLVELHEEHFLIQFILDERNLEFVLGCLSGYITLKYKCNQELPMILISIFLLVTSILNTKNMEYSVLGLSPVIAYGLPFTLLIIGSVMLEKRKSINIPYILTYIGDSSYSIYLTHGFFIKNIFKFMSNNFNQPWIENNFYTLNSMYIVTMLSVVAIGCLIHSYLEKPLIARIRTII